MRLLLVISLSAMMALCAVAEDRTTILKEKFLSLPRQEQVAYIKALLVRGFMDDKLQEFLESLKDMMLNGSEDWGLPILDPFTQEHLDVSLNEEELIELEATVDQLSATGLSNYDVTLAKFDLIKQNMSFGLLFLDLKVLAEHYWINSTVANMLPIFGEGSIDVRVTDLSIGGNIVIGINGSFVYLKTVNLDISLGAIKTNITGLLGGGELSDLINEIISETAPDLLEELKPDIMPEINNLVIEIGNTALAGITLKDIIDIIMGNNKVLRYRAR